ncbi:MAG: co-chaperone DjlA [Gammaproteobacteria bacterium]|nr:co-chaperone DjlA [Gammaproteobacteria bacterium]
MSWWGKVIGGAFGFVLGGPLGAVFGAALGHNFDVGRKALHDADELEFDSRERAQTAFFTASFAVMGYLAKADGRVTRDEVRTAAAIMDQMGLDAELKQVAQSLFREGRQRDFDLAEILDQLRRECRGRRNLLRLFIEIQLAAAYADGVLDPREHRVLLQICEKLGFSRYELGILDAMTRARQGFRAGASRTAPEKGVSLQDAYAMLNVSPSAEPPDIKRAYRRLMSQHHPDKLVAKGLPEEMVKVATQRTQEIKAAYERVREARGF